METAAQVRETLADMGSRFPDGLEYEIPYDTTEFIEASIQEVVITLGVALLLVMAVTFLFLQHLCSTLIPLVAIPVSLIGTFAGMQALGLSVNLLTLFGLILAIGVLVFAAIIGASLFTLSRMANGLVPQEDQGFVLAAPMLPAGAALGRTEVFRDEMADQLVAMDEVDEMVSFAGFDMIAGALRRNAGVAFLTLADWHKRTGEGQDAASMANRIMGLGAQMQEGNILAFVPPPIQGLSLTGGVEGFLQVRGDESPEEIQAIGERFVAVANERPELVNANVTLDTGIPRYHAEVDREKARAAGVPIDQVFGALQSTFGADYVNDFTLEGRS